MTINYDDFSTVDLRSGTVVKAEVFEKARKPAYKVWIYFGETIGVLQTSAQITVHYTPESLVGRQVIACINLGEKNIAGFISQCLLVGFADEAGYIKLASVDGLVPDGQKLH